MTPALSTRVVALTFLLGAAWPAGAEPLDSAAARIEQVILDIVSFARWPKPAPLLRLCVVGPSAYAGKFRDTTVNNSGISVHATQMSVGDVQIGAHCDIVYEGALTEQEREYLVRSLAGHPVLTVGESVSGCLQTTMFCLEITGLPMTGGPADDRRIAFSSNLDAIARSGLRLNPRVLLLGRSIPTAR